VARAARHTDAAATADARGARGRLHAALRALRHADHRSKSLAARRAIIDATRIPVGWMTESVVADLQLLVDAS
jgi:hypothetical protein